MNKQITINITGDNEGTESPWWVLIDPRAIQTMMEGCAEHGEVPSADRILSSIAFSIEGPFFSRKEGEDYLKARAYDYSKNAGVWCSSGYRSAQYRNAIRAADTDENKEKL